MNETNGPNGLSYYYYYYYYIEREGTGTWIKKMWRVVKQDKKDKS